eukprot:610166_1
MGKCCSLNATNDDDINTMQQKQQKQQQPQQPPQEQKLLEDNVNPSIIVPLPQKFPWGIVTQCGLRILEDHMHGIKTDHFQFDVTPFQYRKWDAMPLYIRELANNQFCSIKKIQIGGVLNVFCDALHTKLLQSFFLFQNGHINLELITASFPSVEYIHWTPFDGSIMTDAIFWFYLLAFVTCISTDVSNVKLECICVSSSWNQKIIHLLPFFQHQFQELNWCLGVSDAIETQPFVIVSKADYSQYYK